MAVAGFYSAGAPAAPYVRAVVYLPRLTVAGQVDLLLDTGADGTTLHLGEMEKLGVQPSALTQGNFSLSGVGGAMSYAQEDAYVFLEDRDAGGWRYFLVRLALCAPEEPDAADAVRGLPSLLGRDILNRCRCILDPSQGSVVLEPFEDVGFLPDPSP